VVVELFQCRLAGSVGGRADGTPSGFFESRCKLLVMVKMDLRSPVLDASSKSPTSLTCKHVSDVCWLAG
jgi:hypothetical protein